MYFGGHTEPQTLSITRFSECQDRCFHEEGYNPVMGIVIATAEYPYILQQFILIEK